MQLGTTAENDVVVDEGLKAGERIVVDGILKVQPGALVKGVPLRCGSRAEALPRSTGADGRCGKDEKAPVMISNFFIDRPLFAMVVSAFIVIAGLAAFRALPISMYPDITPPTVAVTTAYPGASADVIAETVATPLEQALNGVERHAVHPLGEFVERRAADHGHVRGRHESGSRGHQRAEPRAERRCRCCRKKCAARASRSRRACRASCRS